MLGDAQFQGCSPQVQLSLLKQLKQRASAQGVRKAQLQSPAADGVRSGSWLLLLSWCLSKTTPFSQWVSV